MASSLWQQRYLFLLRLCQNTTVSVLCSTNGLPEPSCANGFRLKRAIWYMARGHGFFKVLTHGAKRKAKPPFSVETIRLTFGIPSCYDKHEDTALSCIKSAWSRWDHKDGWRKACRPSPPRRVYFLLCYYFSLQFIGCQWYSCLSWIMKREKPSGCDATTGRRFLFIPVFSCSTWTPDFSIIIFRSCYNCYPHAETSMGALEDMISSFSWKKSIWWPNISYGVP